MRDKRIAGLKMNNGSPVRRSLGKQRPDRLGEPTHFKSFSDGTLIETVRDPQSRDAFRLLVYKHRRARVVERLEHEGTCFVPGEIDCNLAQKLRLATGR